MKNEDLKACPLCNGEARFEEYYDDTSHSICCINCSLSTNVYGDEKTVVKAWNTRATVTPADTAMEDAVTQSYEDLLDAAYKERNQVVSALAKCFPSGIAKTAIEVWDEAWHNCVYIDLPTGQASWHYHDRDAYLFDGLPPYVGRWDGHTTPEKYDRLHALKPSTTDGDAELEIARKRVEHYRRENIALREQIEIYKAANKDELQ